MNLKDKNEKKTIVYIYICHMHIMPIQVLVKAGNNPTPNHCVKLIRSHFWPGSPANRHRPGPPPT